VEIENFERIDSEMTKSLEVLSISPIKHHFIMNNCSWQKIVPSKSPTLVASLTAKITLTLQEKKTLK
jgi:hypothetical protein